MNFLIFFFFIKLHLIFYSEYTLNKFFFFSGITYYHYINTIKVFTTITIFSFWFCWSSTIPLHFWNSYSFIISIGFKFKFSLIVCSLLLRILWSILLIIHPLIKLMSFILIYVTFNQIVFSAFLLCYYTLVYIISSCIYFKNIRDVLCTCIRFCNKFSLSIMNLF